MATLRHALVRLRRSQKGAEFVEFALSLPLLLLVVLGIIDFGLMFQQYLVITNAAREAARVAVLPGYTGADAQARANAYISAALITGGNAATVNAPTYGTQAAGSSCYQTVNVTVTYPHNFLFLSGIGTYFGASFGTKTLSASATMRTETAASACP